MNIDLTATNRLSFHRLSISELQWRYWPTHDVTWLWILVTVFAIADITLTQRGLALGYVELNPLGRFAIDVFGVWAMAGGKTLALGVGYIGFRALAAEKTYVPACLALVWGSAVLMNLHILFG